ncbi:MAG TPA: hypothetical protein VEX15_07965 [Nocardioidaceae bacterium]|nr:hypothetical protein [Nocardioidaceae bacterium]
MKSIERATRVLAKRRERRANHARLRHLRSTPSGQAILAHDNGQTVLTLTLPDDVAEFAVWGIEELVLPPDEVHPRGSRWKLESVATAPTAQKTKVAYVSPDGAGGSSARATSTGPERNVYTFQRAPLTSTQAGMTSPAETSDRSSSDE